MTDTVSPDHPIRQFAFYTTLDVDSPVLSEIEEFVRVLGSSRHWRLAPPEFIFYRDEPDNSSGDDETFDVAGGSIEIYSELPPWSLPRELSLTHLEEVTSLISALAKFSRQRQLDFEIELDGETIGAVESGVIDEGLTEGLLGPWRHELGLAS